MILLASRHGAILLLFSLGWPVASFAQFVAPFDSTLSRLTAEALAAAPTLSMRRAMVQAAEWRVRPSGALPDPMLTTGVMNLTLPRFAFRESDFTEVDVELSQEFPWPGTLAARTRGARAVHRGALADLAAGQRDIRVQVATIYYRLRFVLAARHSLGQQRRLLATSVEITTSRYGTGSAPQTEPLQARVAVARLDAEDAGLVEEEAGLRAGLSALRNVAQGEALDIAPLDPKVLSEPQHHPDSTDLDPAVAGHPRLTAREAAIEAAEQLVEAERLAARPDFTIMTRYGARPLGADFFSAFVGVRVPLWAGRKQHRLADAARADVIAARAQLEEERTLLTAEVATTLARVRASQARIAILADRVLPAAREAVDATMRGYRVGQVDFLNLLSVQDGLYRTELETAELLAAHLTHLVMLEQLLVQGVNND